MGDGIDCGSVCVTWPKEKKNWFNYTLRGFQTPVSHDFNLAVIGMSHDTQPGKHTHTHTHTVLFTKMSL